MNLKTVSTALTVAAMAALGTGCGSACDDLQGCCEALDLGAVCDVYNDADEDQCQASKDKLIENGSDDLPDECQF
ncbi:MAG: hypothetical protein WKG00_39935 [Polyangiaceae bacterium]